MTQKVIFYCPECGESFLQFNGRCWVCYACGADGCGRSQLSKDYIREEDDLDE